MDPTRRAEPGDTGTDLGVVDTGRDPSAALRAEYPHPSKGGPAVVSCPNCSAIVCLTDSECWRCTAYFGPDVFDAQR
jgi:hypothetical protein